MTLLSPLALLLGVTALVPLILHLYQRRQRAVIEFSTNRFFTTSIVRSQRRLRLRRLLLLLLRIATCVLLALALAHPLTTIAGFGGRAGTRDVVIVLDDSLSMQARPSARDSATPESTCFDQARQMAIDALGELAAGDRAAVITFTGRTIGQQTRAGLELSEDLLNLADEVGRLRPTFAGGDALNALDHAAKLFAESTPRHRLLLVLSDLQAGDWREMDWPQPIHQVSTALARVSGPPEDNVVIDQMELSEGTAVVGQPSLLRVRLLNHRKETTPAELILHVNDKERLRRPIELPGQCPHVERIPLVFDQAGEHRLKVQVASRDALAADNTLYATLRVSPQLPVLLIDGQNGGAGADTGRPGRSAAAYLRAALQAVSPETGAPVADQWSLSTIRPDVLTPATLEGYRVAILSEVKALSVAQVETLERFVRDGGGLAIFLGDYADRAFYNDLMAAPSRPLGGLLPAELQALVDSRDTLEPLHILAADLDHPILQRFKGTLRSALAGVLVYRAYAVRPRDAWVLASLDQDLPLLLERSYGAGRVLLCTTAPHPRWTNLPLRRAFVPLCSRTVSYLAAPATGLGPRGHFVGEDLELLCNEPVPPASGAAPAPSQWNADQPLYVSRPDGARLRAALRVDRADLIPYIPAAEVEQPGFYSLDPAAAGLDAAHVAVDTSSATGESAAHCLAVNVPRCESSPDSLDLDAAKKLSRNWHLHLVDTAAEARMQATDPTPTDATRAATLVNAGWLSRGIWDALLWTVFVLVLAEPLIANTIIRFRRNVAAGPRTGRPLSPRSSR